LRYLPLYISFPPAIYFIFLLPLPIALSIFHHRRRRLPLSLKNQRHLRPLHKIGNHISPIRNGTSTSSAAKAVATFLSTISHSSSPWDDSTRQGLQQTLLLIMARGEEAIAGEKERISTHRFPPESTDRVIFFKGYYLSIYNQQTEESKTHIDNEAPTTEYERFEVPAGYTVYVRRASVYFEV